MALPSGETLFCQKRGTHGRADSYCTRCKGTTELLSGAPRNYPTKDRARARQL